MDLFHKTLEGPNAFPHGLYWMSLKGRKPLPAVLNLLEQARSRGIKAELVEIETFDALMARIWSNPPRNRQALLRK